MPHTHTYTPCFLIPAHICLLLDLFPHAFWDATTPALRTHTYHRTTPLLLLYNLTCMFILFHNSAMLIFTTCRRCYTLPLGAGFVNITFTRTHIPAVTCCTHLRLLYTCRCLRLPPPDLFFSRYTVYLPAYHCCTPRFPTHLYTRTHTCPRTHHHLYLYATPIPTFACHHYHLQTWAVSVTTALHATHAHSSGHAVLYHHVCSTCLPRRLHLISLPPPPTPFTHYYGSVKFSWEVFTHFPFMFFYTTAR